MDQRLQGIMKNIFHAAYDASVEVGKPGDPDGRRERGRLPESRQRHARTGRLLNKKGKKPGNSRAFLRIYSHKAAKSLAKTAEDGV